MSGEYITLKGPGRGYLEEKHSKFTGVAAPCATEEEALALLSAVKKEFADASSVVYAYILREQSRKRYSDGGEPQKTAGLPALTIMEEQGIVDACVVVVRYFGGTLLGTGGLVRAFGGTAKLALEAAGIARMQPVRRGSFAAAYPLHDRLRKLLEEAGALYIETDYGADVTFHFTLLDKDIAPLQSALSEATAGGSAAFGDIFFLAV